MNAVKVLLLAVRFALEIGALVALGYWGFTTGGGTLAEIVRGIGTPLAGAVIWGLAVSPKATYGSPLRRAVFEAVVFGAAAIALADAGRAELAIAFAVVALIDSVLVRVI